MSKLAHFLLNNRLLVLALTGTVVVLGIISWNRLPIDAFPDVTNTQVMILTKAPGLAAVDVEQRVSYPIELKMRGLPKVKLVRSLSKSELSQVVIIFEDDSDVYWTRQVVFERLAEVREDLPPGIEPEMGPISTGLGEIFQYTLESDTHTAMELRTLQNWLVAPLLKPVPGVNEVNSFGGFVKQYHVNARPEMLLKYDLTLEEITDALGKNNENVGGSFVIKGWEQTYLRGIGLLGDIKDINRIVLKTHDGTPVYLKDVADVVVGSEIRQGSVTRDGKGETVAGMVIMLKGENSKEVVSQVKETIEKVKTMVPEGVTINTFYDRTSLIEACIKTVTDALLEGGILVIVVLFLFLAEIRTALVVLFSIPLTFLGTFILMGEVGLASNLMTIGGLAFSVGMVVDATIVVVENIRRHLATGDPGTSKRQLTIKAFTEVVRPVAFSVTIIVIILVPLYSLQSVEGKMFEPLASTMLIALGVSLLVALLIVPVLSESILSQKEEKTFGFVKRIHRGYMELLQKAMRYPWVTVGLAGVFLAVAAFLYPMMGKEFIPPLNEGSIAVNIVRLPNAALKGTTQVSSYLEKELLKFPEVETVVSKNGRAEISEDPMGPEQTDAFIMLKPERDWTTGRSKAELVEAINEKLLTIPGIRLSFSQPIALRVNELISGVKSDLAVKVFGEDLEILKENADEIAEILGGIEGSEDIKVEQVTGMAQYDINIDRSAVARYGINVADVTSAIEIGIAGKEATTMIEGERRFKVLVRLPKQYRNDVETIKKLLIPAPDGARVRLGDLASIQLVEAPAQVSRENGIRRVVVETNIRGRDLGGFVEEAQGKIATIEKGLPPGYFITFGGQFENQQRAMRQLSIVVPIALILIVVLLYLAIGTVRHSVLVLLNLPFALVGGVIAAVAFGMDLSVSAAVAFIVLLGIAVQNGVVLVTFIRQLQKEGMPVRDAVLKGCELRFRPLLMTALTSFIGHIPMIYALGSGSDIQRPLAVIVNGGLITSSLLTLFVLPAIYSWFSGARRETNLADPSQGGTNEK
jgi:cobalt-zinc-cadmium resistance protein CzcA